MRKSKRGSATHYGSFKRGRPLREDDELYGRILDEVAYLCKTGECHRCHAQLVVDVDGEYTSVICLGCGLAWGGAAIQDAFGAVS